MYAAVLVPLDGSQSAAAGIPPGLEFAKVFATRLVLLKVLPAPPNGVTDGQGRREYEALRYQAESYLESLKRSLRTRGVIIECLVRCGDPTPVILETAQSLGGALLVITPNGMSPAGPEGAHGSVATELLHRAEGPVVLIRPRTELRDPPSGVAAGR
jgi:nucleotide-binding universal stress UspA family protein